MAGRPLPARYEPLPRLGQAEEVPVAASASAVVGLLAERPGTQALLLGNHGVLGFGRDTEAAVSLLVVLEEAAEGELLAAAVDSSA
jgi:L-fuculose-phosphate aldolase